MQLVNSLFVPGKNSPAKLKKSKFILTGTIDIVIFNKFGGFICHSNQLTAKQIISTVFLKYRKSVQKIMN
jgi:hypothetical protein